MAGTKGSNTKDRILQISERLFSEKGYDGTSVEEISRLCNINKATVYYHFKSKEEILDSLMHSILREAKKMVDASIDDMHGNPQKNSLRMYIERLLDFMAGKKQLVSIIIMESLKGSNKYDLLFRCADVIIGAREEGMYEKLSEHGSFPFNDKKEYLVYEFFTGFIPVIMFIVLQDKWSEYYECRKERMIDNFIQSFERSHMSVHREE